MNVELCTRIDVVVEICTRSTANFGRQYLRNLWDPFDAIATVGSIDSIEPTIVIASNGS